MKTGTVKRVKRKKTKDRTYKMVKIGDNWYSLWNKTTGIKKGQKVVSTYDKKKKDGKEYRNITEIYPLTETEKTREGKLTALKAATKLARFSSREIKAPELLKTAEKIREWLKGE